MKFLVGLDDTNASRYALKIGCKYAKAFGSKVVAFTTIDGDIITLDSDIEKAKKYLESAARYLKGKGVEVETKISARGFTPGEDIVNYARENSIEAIFIGVQRRSRVDKLIFGSNALYIIQHAHCPVTTIK